MKVKLLLVWTLLFSLVISTFGQQSSTTNEQKPQQPDAAKQESPAKKDDAVKISVTLVQVDVTVTDSKGRPVSDLKAEDFEVYEDGRPQKITNFSKISVQPKPESAAPVITAKPPEKNQPVVVPPPARLRPNQVQRTISLVVDDLSLSFESTPYVKAALKKFVDEQMQPGDLVAIIRTGAGMGALQQFTNDKRLLYAAIERVRWSPSHGTIYTFAPVTADPNTKSIAYTGAGLHGGAPKGLDADGEPIASPIPNDSLLRSPSGGDLRRGGYTRSDDIAIQLREEIFAVGTLGALGFIVRGLKELPGRKSVILFSDALRIYNREQSITRIQLALKNLTDQANRASVVVYTIDARGLQPLTITAADDLGGPFGNNDPNPNRTSSLESLTNLNSTLETRRRDFLEAQEGLSYLAEETGGLFIRNNNDLNLGIRRALKDQESYYLLGYVPSETTFKPKKGGLDYHDIKVKVKRPDMRVRTRSGFYGITDEDDRPLQGTLRQSLLTALTSPFDAGDVSLRLTSSFARDAQKGSFISSLLHIDAKDLTFAKEADGQRKASIEIAAFTFGDNGQAIDQSIRHYTVLMSEQEYERTLRAGIFYRINLPIKKPGAYQLRTAVRDTASLKLGSANQLIEVPAVEKGAIALSGIIVRGIDTAARANPQSAGASAADQAASTREGRINEADPQTGPAVRRFIRGMILEYAYLLYNANLDKATRRPHLETQLRLYRDGQPVYTGKVKTFDGGAQQDFKRLVAGGSFQLGKELQPGDYVLQVIVADRAEEKKSRTVSQWIDFEIVSDNQSQS